MRRVYGDGGADVTGLELLVREARLFNGGRRFQGVAWHGLNPAAPADERGNSRSRSGSDLDSSLFDSSYFNSKNIGFLFPKNISLLN
jgi:hypothetical protein